MGSVDATSLAAPRLPQDLHVAIIGAGVSGVATAAHLLKHGIRPIVFERSNVAGGIWHLDPRVPDDIPYPNETPSKGDYVASTVGQYSDRVVPESGPKSSQYSLDMNDEAAFSAAFAPPGPAYNGLLTNIETQTMRTSLGKWPDGTPDLAPRDVPEKYILTMIAEHGVEEVIQYNTRVEEVRKAPGSTKWTVRTLKHDRVDGRPRLIENVSEFDAVIMASGHFNMARVPSIPGIKEWRDYFKDSMIHAKRYRTPEIFRGKTALVIGRSASAVDICKELDGVASKTYSSIRKPKPGCLEIPPQVFKAEHVAEVDRFVLPDSADDSSSQETKKGSIVLKDGRVLTDVDCVILATGYITSYPYLVHLHADDTPGELAGPETLVTADGSMTHNMYRHIFYIPDPSLMLVGAICFVPTFNTFDFQAQVVARVLAGKASLPGETQMREEYRAFVKEKGLGREFHCLRGEGVEESYVRELVALANRNIEGTDIEPMVGHTEEWFEAREQSKARLKKRLAGALLT